MTRTMEINRKKVQNIRNIDFLTNKMGFKYLRADNKLMSWIQMKSKYDNLCCDCHKNIYEGSEIYWNNDGSSKVKHSTCSSTTKGATVKKVSEETVDLAALDSGLFSIITEEEIDEIWEKKSFEQRKQEREFFREGISP